MSAVSRGLGTRFYIHPYFWPGTELAIGGLTVKVKSAKMLRTGTPVKFEQTTPQTKFTGLTASAPDSPVTTLAVGVRRRAGAEH
jgi:alpha-L-fucosidase